MMVEFLGAAVLVALCAGAQQGGDGPVAQWDFDEGRGNEAQDSGGNGIHGRVHGAEWIARGDGHALRFDGLTAHVACGDTPGLDITGPVSVEAWVYPTEAPGSETGIAGKSFDSYALTIYGDLHFYWYISSGGNKCRAPAAIRYWSHLVGTFDGEALKLYVNGELKHSTASQFKEAQHGGEFFIGRILHSTDGGVATESFNGVLDSVRVYDRALSAEEIRGRYATERSGYRRMEPGLDQISMNAFCYFEDGAAFVDVDFGNLFPFAENERAEVTLWQKGSEQPQQRVPVTAVPETGIVRDLEVRITDIAPGEYELRATLLRDADVVSEATATFAYPARIEVPSPAERVVPPLPPAPRPIDYTFELCAAGGFRIRLGGDTYPVESTYSYPHGGENGLMASDTTRADGEPSWRVALEQEDDVTHRVRAGGAYYAMDRRILLKPDHILVRDTITNSTSVPLGIILENRIGTGGKEGLSHIQLPNPTVFVCKPGQGLGMVALDDVYLEQYETFFEDGVGGIRSRKFALDAGASYTLEWAVYVNGTGDYYDFINAVRKGEGLIRTVEGGFAFMDRRSAPSKEFVNLRALKYISVPCLSRVVDDPGISVEGIEFTEYPEECALLKETFAETRKRHPELEVMFHVAHSLYATNEPEALFPDSRTLDASGSQTDYGGNNIAYYLKYFSKEHVEEGYRWFIFYPARDNRFGPAMLRATDFMLDEIGVTGMFADGLTHGYGGRFTYDRWDGHSAEIDPETKTITRKMGSVNLLGQDILIEVVRKINERGGVVIANSSPGTRTFHTERVIYCLETASGDKTCARLHLAPTVIGLGNPARIQCERDVYDDMRGKLEWGALYFYYGEGEVTRQTVTAQMYPITVEEIRPGTIRGRERIITTRAGVYGWREQAGTVPSRRLAWDSPRFLHLGYRYDGRGVLTARDFVTTVDEDGVRTELTLEENETAVLKKVPIVLEGDRPVSLIARHYDEQAVGLMFNGTGPVRLTVNDGEFPITPGADYIATVGNEENRVRADSKRLTLGFSLDGETQFRLRHAPAV